MSELGEPYMYWEGGPTSHDRVHDHDDGPTFARYRRIPQATPNPWGPDLGPDFLVIAGLERWPAPAPAPAPASAATPLWRICWRQIWQSAPAATPPDWIKLIAWNPRPEASPDEVERWNRFYSDIHAPEAVDRRGWSRGSRWECVQADAHPAPGCPRFIAVYEAVGPTATDEEVAAKPPFTDGPPFWDENVTSWVVDYRREG